MPPAAKNKSTSVDKAVKQAPAGNIFNSSGNFDDEDLPEDIEARSQDSFEESETLLKDAMEVKNMVDEVKEVSSTDSALHQLAKSISEKFERLESRINQIGAQTFTQSRKALPRTPLEDLSDETPVEVVVTSTGHFRWGSKVYNLNLAGEVVELPRCFANRLKKNKVVRDLI